MSYELIRCQDCHHERVRPREKRFYLPCQSCGSEEQEVFDLVEIERDDTDSYVPTPEGIRYVEEVMGHAA